MRLRTLFPLGILVFVAILLALSLQYELEAALFPWVFGSITLFMLVGQIWREVAARKRENGVVGSTELRPYVVGIAWVVGILPTVYLLGFLVGLPLYCFLYFKLHGQKWLPSIGLSLLVAAVIYGGFIVGLGFSFYKGLLFQ